MAILKEGIDFTGSIGNMTAYKMKGSDKIILRKKGGASKEKIHNHPRFELTRLNMSEFGGCAKAVKSIRKTLWYVKSLADHNFTPSLTELCLYIQKQDTQSKRGKRNVYVSRHRPLLEGFRLNEQTKFGDVVAGTLACTIDREKASATIQLPALLPGLNLQLPWKQPLFRFIFTLCVAEDAIFDARPGWENYPEPEQPAIAHLYTDWHMKEEPFDARKLALELNLPTPLEDRHTLIVAAGIEMGLPVSHNFVKTVKYAGCAEILAAG
ncbi:hypothetical protein F0L74_12945 [Chitinophaga agrisoli]|uniref:Uncharacterized protein n=1 Tax=Chitinophaga agrisoli TaxID=2607653 RepID=A0A5B2VYJ7_9BACT|nr:hypothetical protein [Chitinophaga agrisoli]KAA2243402.1 hypothetical protein F0L74_12945 [Chitinophaga agrisoli]